MVIIDSLKTHWLLLMPSLVQFCGRSIQDLTFDLALVDSSSSSFSNACFASFAATFIPYLPPPPHTIYCFLLSFLASFNIQPLAAGFGLLLAHRRVLCFMFMPVSSSSLSMRPYFFFSYFKTFCKVSVLQWREGEGGCCWGRKGTKLANEGPPPPSHNYLCWHTLFVVNDCCRFLLLASFR